MNDIENFDEYPNGSDYTGDEFERLCDDIDEMAPTFRGHNYRCGIGRKPTNFDDFIIDGWA